MIEFFDLLKEKMSQIYFIIVFTVLTLYVHDGYFDMIVMKGNMLLWTTLFYVVTMVVSDVCITLSDKKKGQELIKDINTLDYVLIAFAWISIISAMISKTPQIAMWGSDGCHLGAVSICLLCASCIFMTRYLMIEKYMIIIMALSGVVVYIGGITDCFDLDIMGWHENIAASHYDYLSTIGNRDYFDGYLALLLPFFAILFIFEKDIRWRIGYGAYLFLGFINLYIVKNDGNLLIFGCGIFLVYYMLKEHADIKGAVWLLLIFAASSIAVRLICVFVDPVNVTGNSIMGVLLRYHWYIVLLFLAAILWLIRNVKFSYPLDRIWIGFSVGVILILFVIVIVNYDRTFASNRGYIWSYGIETFIKSPPRVKLAGWGPDCYENAIYTTVGDEIAATWPEANVIANAHNEMIQYLVTTGIIGMGLFIAVYVISLFGRREKYDIFNMAANTAIFAYFCQSLGNNPNGLNHGILFVMFAIANIRNTRDIYKE